MTVTLYKYNLKTLLDTRTMFAYAQTLSLIVRILNIINPKILCCAVLRYSICLCLKIFLHQRIDIIKLNVGNETNRKPKKRKPIDFNTIIIIKNDIQSINLF